MWIIVWRILMLLMALVLLGVVIWIVVGLVTGSRRQSEDVKQLEREREPDIEDANYTESDAEKRREDSDGG